MNIIQLIAKIKKDKNLAKTLSDIARSDVEKLKSAVENIGTTIYDIAKEPTASFIFNPGQHAKDDVKDLGDIVNGLKRIKQDADAINAKYGLDNKSRWSNFKDLFKKGNHENWYTNDPDLLTLATPVSVLQPINTPVLKDGNTVLPWCPSRMFGVGITVTAGDSAGFGLAARKIWNSIRRSNSGATNYTVMDIKKLLISLQYAVTVFNHVNKIYNCIDSYTSLDLKAPEDILHACGVVDTDSVIDNAATLYNALVKAYKTLSTYPVPKMDRFARLEFLLKDIFADTPLTTKTGAKQQLYVVYPEFVEVVDYEDEFDGPDSTYLRPLQWHDLAAILNELNQVCAMIKREFTNNIIVGDILKAFGINVVKYDKPLSRESLKDRKPIYDITFLAQLENATICHPDEGFYTNNGFRYLPNEEDNITMQCNFKIADDIFVDVVTAADRNLNRYFAEPFITFENMRNGTLDGGKLYSVTRFASAVVDTSYANSTITFDAQVTTELISTIKVVQYYADTTGKTDLIDIDFRSNIQIFGHEDSFEPVPRYHSIMSCEHLPLFSITIDMMQLRQDDPVGYSTEILNWDWDIYAKVDAENLQDIHYVATFSLWFTPDLIKLSNNVIELVP